MFRAVNWIGSRYRVKWDMAEELEGEDLCLSLNISLQHPAPPLCSQMKHISMAKWLNTFHFLHHFLRGQCLWMVRNSTKAHGVILPLVLLKLKALMNLSINSCCPCLRLCVCRCLKTGAGASLFMFSCLSPLLPSPTCRGMRPSRGVPRGCLPGLDFVSLSADVFLCLRSRSPRPRSPRQRPRPRPRHCSKRHWPAVTLSGKLSLAQAGSPSHGMRTETPQAAVFAYWSSAFYSLHSGS